MPKRLSLVDATARRKDEFVREEGMQPEAHSGPPIEHLRIEPPRKKTTFNLDAALHQRLKLAAVRHRREMVDIVEEALLLQLRSLEEMPAE